jgi:heat shock protein HslJ
MRGPKFRTARLRIVAGLILCALLLLTFTSCMGRREANQLEDNTWILTAYAVGGAMKDALPTPLVDATFADGKLSGNGGVNQYSGSYEVDGSKMRIGPLASTAMAGDPAVMAQEAAYLANLEDAGAFNVDGDTLTIKDASADIILEFRSAGE